MEYSKSHLILVLILLSSLTWGSFATRNSFNVNNFGAKGDGATDSTKAFLAAWQAACGSSMAAEVYVPVGYYLLQPVTFEGECKSPRVTFWMDGKLVTIQDFMVIADAGRWIQFNQVNNLVIQGATLVGRAQYLPNCTVSYHKDPKCPYGGTMLSISKSSNVWINKLTSVHSQGFHVIVTNSQNVHFFKARIIAPDESPNTDGIHVQRSTGVSITDSSFQTGDDCISLSQGSQDIFIQNVWCVPGHGISIGSLGSAAGEEAVRNVTVRGAQFKGTQNGFRIKTWAKPFAVTVDDIHFSNANMMDVANPIIIDQYYCPRGGCAVTPSYAKISNVEFNGIHGNSSTEVAIKFDYSAKFPCTGLSLKDIRLSHSPTQAQSEIKNAAVQIAGVVQPSVGHN